MTFRSCDAIMILDLYLNAQSALNVLYMDIPIKYHIGLAHYMVEDIQLSDSVLHRYMHYL